MTQMQVNIIGAIILGALFYYQMIWKPKKLLKSPSDLMPVRRHAPSLKLSELVYKNFANEFFIISQQPFNLLIHSPSLSKNSTFLKELQRLEADAVLVDRKTNLPVLAIILSDKDDDRKGNLISNIGVGCLIFKHVDDEAEIVNSIKQYLVEQKQQHDLAIGI